MDDIPQTPWVMWNGDGIGWDTSYDAVHIATLPDGWGYVTKFEERNGKLLVYSSSGNVMIVPRQPKST